MPPTTSASNPLGLHPLFADHAVLPRDVALPIAGRALPGQPVKVSFAGTQATARTNAAGRWEVVFDPLPAGGPHILTVSSSTGQLIRRNIMVGDVWLAAGASGMSLPIEKSAGSVGAIKRTDLARLRLFTVPRRGATEPQIEPEGRWRECTVQSAVGFSALALHFARTVASAVECTVGVIEATWPGSDIVSWMPAESIRSRPDLQAHARGWGRGGQPRSSLRPADEAEDELFPSGLFHGMIAPLTRLPIRGVIWHQGEADLGSARAYRSAFIGLIHGWRVAWERSELPFLFVQLPAARSAAVSSTADEAWAALREAQSLARDLPATSMVISADLSAGAVTAPLDVRPFADRLSLGALAVAYRRSMPHGGPVVNSHGGEGGEFRVKFEPPGVTLRPRRPGAIDGFLVSGADGRFVSGVARIEGDSVVVSSPAVAQPVAVRYGWQAVPRLSLEDGAGLPVAPFRTDTWPLHELDHS